MKDIEEWWNSVKDSGIWSGAIVNIPWDGLWPLAQQEIAEIYKAAIE